MKKVAFTLLLAAGLQVNSQNLLAQTESSDRLFNFGVTAGFNASTITDNDYVKVGGGFNVGVMGLFTFADSKVGHVIVEPAVLFSRESYRFDYDKLQSDNAIYEDDGGTWDGFSFIPETGIEHIFKNHLKVPVQVGYEFKLGDKVTIGPKVGLELDYGFEDDDSYGYTALNLVEGLNVNYMKRFRLALGWQSNLKYFGSTAGPEKWVNFNANIAYLLF